ncbi:MAG: DUF2147 domain-containing protein [Chitinophagales bacterium]|nr:DUF2147 domain-containing protein [Chitinophagales bacterium]
MKGLITIITLFTLTNCIANTDSTEILNYWLTDTEEYIVQIYEENGVYKGKIVWLLNPLAMDGEARRDVMNNEPELRSRLLMGLDVLDGFEYDDGDWRHGSVYNFKNGNDYNAHLKIDNDGNLRWTGYYGILFFLGKTKVWTPVSDLKKYGLK